MIRDFASARANLLDVELVPGVDLSSPAGDQLGVAEDAPAATLSDDGVAALTHEVAA